MAEAPESKPPVPRWRRRLWRATWVSSLALLGVAAVGAGVLGWGYHRYVVAEPGAHLDRDHILSIIAQESPVYYRDGTTRIGVFFDDEHRQYVSWEELPPPYVVSIVAAEDGNFWSHRGISPKHIARAVLDNTVAGRTVSGGSTLTQQTAKNIYYRPDRSLRSKGVELLNALRLEAHFDKSEILTFYVNQFHVSGNGRGLGIAARYFFDKEVGQLTLLESAYLAGLVKGPGHYDPFLGDAARQQRSRERAVSRTRYVLQRIVDEDMDKLIGPWPVDATEARAHAARQTQVVQWKREAQDLLDKGFELPFRRGRFRYDSSAVLDEVKARLAEPPFDQVLAEAGIADPNKAGLVVVTTLDPHAQNEAIYALWHHLTEVGTWMEKLTPQAFLRTDSRGPRHDPYHTPRAHEFRLGSVVAHVDDGGRTVLDLDLGSHSCRVDRDALVRVALAVERGQTGNRYAKVPGAKVDAFAAALKDGDTVWVSVREVPSTGPALCDLEVRPELQGSVVVVDEGRLLAMVGGNDNRNFNRATAARQFGSTWKPLVYHAALELGWRPDDPLDNRRNVFPFSTTFYHPRPDHSPEPVVSMSWAGVNSENLASVWLLYHLTDRLGAEQVASLAQALDLARRPDEGDVDYRTRIQKAGVLPTRGRLREALFLKARADVLLTVAASTHPEDQLPLASLLYGWGHTAEIARVEVRGGSERARKVRALQNSWRHLEERLPTCGAQHQVLRRAVERRQVPDPALVPDLAVFLDGEVVRVACGALPAGYVVPDAEGLGPLVRSELPDASELDEVLEQGPTPRSLGRRIGDWLGLGAQPAAPDKPAVTLAAWEDVLIDDRLHVATLQAVDRALARREAVLELAEEVDLYDPDLLYWHQDFRVLLALRYVERLAQQYGVRTEIQPVLSLPLGASEITLEEAAATYEGLVTGQAWRYPGTAWKPGALVGASVPAPSDPALLIAELRDVDGRVIYRAEAEPREVVRPDTAAMTADILRNVVLHGTGRRAATAVQLGGAPVPLGGKTGTTNDFRNAAFLGMAPRWEDGAFHADQGAVIGVYVGYDDNRPMSQGRIRLAGASGALPAWIGTAQGLADGGLLGAPDVAPPEDGWVLAHPRDLSPVPVDGVHGLPLGLPLPALEPELEGEGPDEDAATDAPMAATWSVLAPAPAAVVAPAPVHVDFEQVPVRVAPTTEEAAERARRRRELLEGLEAPREAPTLWDTP